MKFSILIPAFKSKYLKECLDSILVQTYKDSEVIIVNDASPEDLDSIIFSYNDDRIQYYKNEKNFGALNVVDNWNKCLKYANGDYVICMGDDDRLLPNCLEEYVDLMRKYPGLGVYHAWTEIIDENSKFCGIQHPRPEYESVLSLVWNRWNGRNSQYIGDFCFEREALIKNGGFYFLPMAWASDDISVVIAADRSGIANTQKLCFQYRENRNTITKSGDWNSKIDATLKEERWVEDYLERKKLGKLSEIDNKYLKLLLDQKENHFKNKYKYSLKEGFASKSISLYQGLTMRSKICLSLVDVFKCWIKSKR